MDFKKSQQLPFFIVVAVLSFFWASLSLAVSHPRIRRGGADSGGGDNTSPYDGTAWFLGDRNIRYCTQIAPGFGLSSDEAYQTIENVFSTWKQYLTEKRIHTDFVEFASPLNHLRLEKCDGSQDLTFLFGVQSDEVTQAKAQFENPSAFSHRSSYDGKAGWGKGFIWIAPPGSVYPENHFPDWTLPSRLNGMLLHEMGHVLGCGHYAGTIMTEYISPMLMAGNVRPDRLQAMLTHIDDSRELNLCFDCLADFSGAISQEGKHQGDVATFRRLVGKDPRGTISAHFKFIPHQPSLLTLGDNFSETNFSITFRSEPDNSVLFKSDNFQFNAFKDKEPSEGGISGIGYLETSQLVMGKIVGSDGKAYVVMMERNEDNWGYEGGKLRLTYLIEDNRLPLFVTHLPVVRQ